MRPTEADSKMCAWRRLSRLTAGAAGLALCLTTLVSDKPAAAQEFTLHVEPALAIYMDEPQSSRFSPGLYFAIRPGVALGSMVAVQWSYALLFTPSGGDFTEDGSAHFLTTGLRLRPFGNSAPEAGRLGGLFIDANVGYVRTEGLDRFGFDVGLGYGFQVEPWFSFGLVARYGQIVQPDDNPNQDPNDAQFMTIGFDLAFGPAPEEEVQRQDPICPGVPECVQKEPICPVQEGCPDSDRDGVCDVADRCPTQIGPPATLGCPIDPCSGKPLIVLVQFKYDSAQLPAPKDDDPQSMDPVLDAVAKAISQDPSCRVCVMGYASEEGTADYNDALSRRRASAVQGYLIARGLVEKRIPSTGHGERCQLVPERSLERNRRVEFLRLQEGESCPADCSK